jgi:hypothetical protein
VQAERSATITGDSCTPHCDEEEDPHLPKLDDKRIRVGKVQQQAGRCRR